MTDIQMPDKEERCIGCEKGWPLNGNFHDYVSSMGIPATSICLKKHAEIRKQR